MRKYLYLLMVLSLFIIGCISPKITPYTNILYPPTRPETVQVFQFTPSIPFEIIGEVEVSGAAAASRNRVERKLKEEAARIGGDAVVVSKGRSLVAIQRVNPNLVMPIQSKHVYGVVIKWKKR